MKLTPRFLYCVSGEGGMMRALLANWQALAMPGHVAGILSDRICPAHDWAKANGYASKHVDYHAHTPDSFARAFHAAIDSFRPDYLLLNFNRLLAPAITKAYAGRILNLHYALLPAFPGLGVAKKTVASGVRLAGVTVHLVDETCDGGPILAQAALAVGEDAPARLNRRLFLLGAPLLMQAARWAGEGRIRMVNGQTYIEDANYSATPFVPCLDTDIAAWGQQLARESPA